MKRIESKVNEAFARGLKAGFAGTSTVEKISRGKFAMVSSTFNEGGVSYIDQWSKGQMGGGQEIQEVDGERYTRVYAGGTVDDRTLSSLGITRSDVMDELKSVITEAGEKIRFDQPFIREHGKWMYEYIPGDTEKVTGMLSGKEKMSYKKTPVFVHLFIISRVIE